MGILGKLLGSDKVIDSGIKAADAAWFTTEEKAEYHLRVLKAYEPFKLAQRFLALIYSVPYVTLVFVLHVLMACGVADFIDQIELLNKQFGVANTVILSFYFGGGALEGVVRAAGEVASGRKG